MVVLANSELRSQPLNPPFFDSSEQRFEFDVGFLTRELGGRWFLDTISGESIPKIVIVHVCFYINYIFIIIIVVKFLPSNFMCKNFFKVTTY